MKKWMTKTDAWILVVVLLLMGGMFLFRQMQQETSGVLTAVVTVHGKIEMQIDLSSLREPKNYTLSNGVELLAQHNTIQFVKSNCQNKICIQTGTLSHVGDVAACIPEKTVVTLQSSEKENVDVITY